MNGITVEARALAGCGGETFILGWVVHHAGNGTALFDDRGADGEMRPALQEGNGAVDRVHHEDARLSSRAGSSTLSSDSQP